MENATAVKARWVIDPSHSELLFKVKHLMISNVKGEFKSFTAEIDGEDFGTSPIRVSIDSSSVFTNNDDRDTHLKSADFFDADHHREIFFRSTGFIPAGDGNYTLTGQLTIKGVTREVTLAAIFGGINKDPWGNEKAGFSVTGKINRKDWGLNWNSTLETGGLLVSDDVQISAEIQLLKQE